MRVHTYKVQISEHHSAIVEAENAQDAKEQAWADMQGGFTYGWESKPDFMRSAKTTRIDNYDWSKHSP